MLVIRKVLVSVFLLMNDRLQRISVAEKVLVFTDRQEEIVLRSSETVDNPIKSRDPQLTSELGCL